MCVCVCVCVCVHVTLHVSMLRNTKVALSNTAVRQLSLSSARWITSVLRHPISFKMHFNIILPTKTVTSKQTPSFSSSHHSFACISHLSFALNILQYFVTERTINSEA